MPSRGENAQSGIQLLPQLPKCSRTNTQFDDVIFMLGFFFLTLEASPMGTLCSVRDSQLWAWELWLTASMGISPVDFCFFFFWSVWPESVLVSVYMYVWTYVCVYVCMCWYLFFCFAFLFTYSKSKGWLYRSFSRSIIIYYRTTPMDSSMRQNHVRTPFVISSHHPLDITEIILVCWVPYCWRST